MSELTQADQYLLARIESGDPDGWSQLVDRYQGRLLAFARDQLGNAADAEDTVQEAFMSFLKAWPQFRGESSLETYLFSILRRKIVDTFRGRPVYICSLQDGATSLDGEDDMAHRIKAPGPTASWYVRRDEDHDQLEKALWKVLSQLIDRFKSELNFRDLQVAEMIFYAQLRNKDIAAASGIDPKQVALLKHRFLKRIAQDAADDGSTHSGATDGSAFADPAMLTRVWEEHRPSCPKRSTIGAFLLGTLDRPWHDYVGFHLNQLGCRFCQANLVDLKLQDAEPDRETDRLRDRIMQSTVGFLRKA